MQKMLLKLGLVMGMVALAGAAPLNEREASLIRARLMPFPKKIELSDGAEVVLNKSLTVTLACASDGEQARKVCARFFKDWFKITPRIELATELRNAALKAEGYRIRAKGSSLSIEAADLAGARYAMYTLRQLAEPLRHTERLSGYFIPECSIEDAPVMAFRGLHLCWFPENSLTQIERYIRLAAYYKMNVVVLESWGMFKFVKHPEFAWRDSEMTPKNVRHLVKVARELGIELVPQINLFGHASGARVSCGKHAVLDMQPALQPYFEPLGWTWCLSNPATLALHQDMVLELYEAFGKPAYFHVGCDEAYDKGSCLECRRRDYPALVAGHLSAIRDLLAERDCRIMMWQDMLLRTGDSRWKGYYAYGKDGMEKLLDLLPKDVVVCDWYYGVPKKDEKEGATYPTLRHFHSQGFMTLTCPWNRRDGYEGQAKAVVDIGLPGMLSTTWHHLWGSSLMNIYVWSAQAMWGAPIKDMPRLNFTHHLRQIGWDIPIKAYEDTGFQQYQLPRDTDSMRQPQ